MLVFLVDLLAVPGDPTKLEVNFTNKVPILFGRNLFAARLDIDKSSDQARLGICDPDRLVRAKEHKALELTRILAPELLVHQHRLVRDQRVQSCVVFDPRQIAVVLDCNKRVRLECLQCESVRG